MFVIDQVTNNNNIIFDYPSMEYINLASVPFHVKRHILVTDVNYNQGESCVVFNYASVHHKYVSIISLYY